MRVLRSRARRELIGGKGAATPEYVGPLFEPRGWLHRFDDRSGGYDGTSNDLCAAVAIRPAVAVPGSGDADASFLADARCHAEPGCRTDGRSIPDSPRRRSPCDSRGLPRRSIRDLRRPAYSPRIGLVAA